MTQTAPHSFAPDAQNTRDLRIALGRFATGVTVVTTRTDEGVIGITANSFASLSLDPALVLWSPARASGRFAAFAQAESFAIHVLAADQIDLCRHFTRHAHLPFATQAPEDSALRLPGALVVFDCTTHARHDGGDHLLIIGAVQRVTTGPGAPLVFQGGQFGALAAL